MVQLEWELHPAPVMLALATQDNAAMAPRTIPLKKRVVDEGLGQWAFASRHLGSKDSVDWAIVRLPYASTLTLLCGEGASGGL